VAHELFQIVSSTEWIVWLNIGMTQADFDAIDLPPGWLRNNALQGQPDASRFLRSPDASMDGPLTTKEIFGFVWQHPATIVEAGIQLDEQGLLVGTRVAKVHEITYRACRTVAVLVSPEGDAYVRVTRDPERRGETSTLPSGWRQFDYVTPDDLVTTLPNPTLVIRTNIRDSFQGPVAGLDVEP